MDETGVYTVAEMLRCEVSATFTAKTGLSLFLQLSQQDADKYDEEACRRMLDYCYAHTNGQVSLGTIVYLARRVGWQRGGFDF